ncbi:MAG: tryptophan synthase subunit alpha [Acidimicrobiales bacterium]
MRPELGLAPTLLHLRDAGHKLLVPYVTGGLGRDWVDTLEAVAAAGADAVEVGLPFSDPMMDGPVIQRASVKAIAGGATAQRIIAEIASADLGVPVVVMTYYNLVARMGHRRMAQLMAGAKVTGAIVPDLPLEELDGWAEEADRAGIATVLLAAPTTPPERLKLIAKRARGYLYAVGSMGVTGERADLAASAGEIAGRCKAATDLPVLVGVGISTPDQAVEVCRVADGVIVGSALVRRLLDGCGPDGAADLVREFRVALDG